MHFVSIGVVNYLSLRAKGLFTYVASMFIGSLYFEKGQSSCSLILTTDDPLGIPFQGLGAELLEIVNEIKLKSNTKYYIKSN